MFTNRRRAMEIGLSILFTAALGLSGCGGAFRLYDTSRAKMATDIKDRYTKADVLGAIEVERKNLDNLLAEELIVVRANQQLRVDFALLRVADDSTPMADTYAKALARLKELGIAGFKQAREEREGAIDLAAGNRKLQTFANAIKRLTKAAPPPCRLGAPLPATLDVAQPLNADDRASAQGLYDLYRAACTAVQKAPPSAATGLLQQALMEWKEARDEVAGLDRSVQAANKDVEAKSTAYQNALDAEKRAAGADEAEKKVLLDKVAEALKALEKAKDVAKLVGTKSAAAERMDALVVLLSAAAGGTPSTSDEKLKKAAIVAREIPSLVGDMAALLQKAQAPSVSNLLIEMRHQVLLLEYVQQLRGFAQQRTDILKARYDALAEEARLWLRFGDAVCSYAVVKAEGDQSFPGEKCDGFVVKIDKTITCQIGDAPIESCRLEKPWNENIRGRADGVATRELYKALAAYLQALAIQGTQYDQTFLLIDVGHRETLASRESALRGWDNLVAVPISQLDAYYQAGLKPAEIADLLVKALGFAAITVGVTQ